MLESLLLRLYILDSAPQTDPVRKPETLTVAYGNALYGNVSKGIRLLMQSKLSPWILYQP